MIRTNGGISSFFLFFSFLFFLFLFYIQICMHVGMEGLVPIGELHVSRLRPTTYVLIGSQANIQYPCFLIFLTFLRIQRIYITLET